MDKARQKSLNQQNPKVSKKNSKTQETTADVLYQRLGSRWYAFSLIGDEVFVGSISSDVVEDFYLTGVPALDGLAGLNR